MKATELRIGNLVNLCFEHKPGWFVASVTQIFDNNSINTDTEHLHVSGKQQYYFEGIPLTSEWLEKFGLSPDWTWKLNEPVKGTIFQDGKAYGWREEIPLQYVHQMQNLYFALTGKELELLPNNQNT